MVSATRTDKIGKELLAVVDEFADYRYAIGRLSRRVLPNAGKSSTTRIQGREMMVVRNVKDRMCEIFMRGAGSQYLKQALPVRTGQSGPS